MKNSIILLFLFSFITFGSFHITSAKIAPPENYTKTEVEASKKGETPVLDFFHGAECPHCQREKKWHPVLKAMFPGIQINEYEVWHNEENQALLQERLDDLGKQSTGVPTNIIGNEVVTGFSAENIIRAITKTYDIKPLEVDEEKILEDNKNTGKQKKLLIFGIMSLVLIGGGFVFLKKS